MALGGHDIHVESGRPSKRLHYSICKYNGDDKVDAQNIKEHTSVWHPSYHERHNDCFENPDFGHGPLLEHSSIPGLQLLLTCRQIHNEASLIPFAYNSFSFCKCETMVFFAERLLVEQSRAIGRLELHDRHFGWWTGFWKRIKADQNSLKTKFKGLKELIWIVEFRPEDEPTMETFARAIKTLQMWDIRNAVVAAYPPGGFGPIWRLERDEIDELLDKDDKESMETAAQWACDVTRMLINRGEEKSNTNGQQEAEDSTHV